MKHKKIAIFGFGKEGISAANYLGSENKITIIDDKEKKDIEKSLFQKLETKDADFYFGKKGPLGKKFDLLIRSPGFRPDHPKILNHLKKGTPLTTPTNIFFEKAPTKKIIGVTGTKGKGTTSTLIYQMIKRESKNVYLGGNIGNPALEFLPKLDSESTVILELSSFQLIDLKSSPQIAVVLMITSEHLDWHMDKKEYLDAKKLIVNFQTSQDFAVINQDFKKSKELANYTSAKTYYFSTNRKTNGVYVKNNQIISEISKPREVVKVSDILLPGKHNLQNICAAISVAKILKIKNHNIKKSVRIFKGLKHRLQLVRVVNGVKYYNDSYSTIPETAIAAIESFRNPKVLILGGSPKKSDFSDLSKKIIEDKSIKATLLIGQEANHLKDSITNTGKFKGKIIDNLSSMKEIVKVASEISQKNDVVILSPACASFDMFKNYEDRGDQFVKEAESLSK